MFSSDTIIQFQKSYLRPLDDIIQAAIEGSLECMQELAVRLLAEASQEDIQILEKWRSELDEKEKSPNELSVHELAVLANIYRKQENHSTALYYHDKFFKLKELEEKQTGKLEKKDTSRRQKLSPVSPDDYTMAHYYHKKAIEGHPNALHELGLRYLSGRGVPQDTESATNYLRCAANVGYAKSQIILGNHLCKGREVEQAAWLYRQAAERYYDEAQNKLISLSSIECPSAGVIYHAAMAVRYNPGNLKEAFNQLAINKPEAFSELMAGDAWKEVTKLLYPRHANAVLNRFEKGLAVRHNELKQFTPLSYELTQLVLSYFADKSYFKLMDDGQKLEKEIRKIQNVSEESGRKKLPHRNKLFSPQKTLTHLQQTSHSHTIVAGVNSYFVIRS